MGQFAIEMAVLQEAPDGRPLIAIQFRVGIALHPRCANQPAWPAGHNVKLSLNYELTACSQAALICSTNLCPMNTVREWLLRGAILCSGVALGWFMASSKKPEGTTSTTSRQPAIKTAMEPGADTAKGDQKNGEASLSAGERVTRRFETALRSPDRRRRLGAFLTGLDHLTAEEAPELLALIARLNREGVQLAEEWPAFVRRWGEVDGAAAAAHALERHGEPWVQSGLRDIFAGWATVDREAAAQWLNANGGIPEFDAALSGLIGGLAEKDTAAATAAAVASLSKESLGAAGKAMELLADAVVRKGATGELTTWYQTLPHTDNQTSLRHMAFGHVWWRLKQSDMSLAQEWLTAEADKPWRGDRQYAETTITLAEKNPAAALSWAGSLPPSPVSKDWPGATAAYSRWLLKDPQTATAWLTAQPDSPFRDTLRRVAP